MRILYRSGSGTNLLGFDPYVAPAGFDRKAQPVDIYEVFCRYYKANRTAKWIYSVSNTTATTKPHGGTSYRYGYEISGVKYVADLADGDTITWDGSSDHRWVIVNHTTMSMMTCYCQAYDGATSGYNGGAEWLYCGNWINSVITSDSNSHANEIKWIHIHDLDQIDTYAYCCHYGNHHFEGILYLSETPTIIDQHAFDGCYGLSCDLVIPDNFITIEAESFNRCNAAFSSVTFSSNLKSIGIRAFWNTTLGATITFPETLETIGSEAFLNSTGLTGTLTIPESCTGIGKGAFGHTNFTSLVSESDNFEVYDYCLYDITGGGSLALHGEKGYAGPLTLRTGTTKIQEYCFSKNAARTGNFLILNTITEIEQYGFGECTATGTFTFESTSVCSKIGMRGLWGGKWTGTLTLPDSMRQLYYGALSSCTGFSGLVLNAGLLLLDDVSLSGMTGLTGDITIDDSVTTIGAGLLSGTNNSGLGTLVIGSGATSIGAGLLYGTKFQNITCASSGYVVNDYVLYDEKTGGEVKAMGGCLGRVEPLIIKASCTHIMNYSFPGAVYTEFHFYPTAAPNVNAVYAFTNFGKELHVPSGATGYDVPPWTTIAIFSSVYQDL